ncbi:hypothetical protein F5Y19DRAFT_54013 [Xylariaceae sp. FL1651]|nr:hypothetical protein F5Y19DRAFT_54013 [Xylariaceae sp. FL1651]
MRLSIFSALFIAVLAILVSAIPPKIKPTDGADSIPWLPAESITGWPPSSLTLTTVAFQVTAVQTVTVTEDSMPWPSISPIPGWLSSKRSTQTTPGHVLTETLTVTYTSYSVEIITLPSASSVSKSASKSSTPTIATIVTVTESMTPLLSTLTHNPPFTIVTVTASPVPSTSSPPYSITPTPLLTTVTVSEVTVWPTQTTTQSSTSAPRVITLTFTSSSVNWSLNSTTVSHTTTVMTLSPPPTFATGTQPVSPVGTAGVKKLF